MKDIALLSKTIEARFSRGFSWMALGSLMEQVTNAAVFLVLARLLDPASFGLWAMAAALLLLGETLVRETLSDYLIAARHDTMGLRSTVFWCLVAIGVAIALVLAVIAGPLARFYAQPQVAGLVLAIAPIPLLLGGSAVPAALLRRELHFKALSLRAFAGMVAGGVVGIWMALAGYGVWALVGQRFLLAAVNAAIAWMAIDWRPRLRFDRTAVGPLLAFGRGVVGVRLAELSVVQLPSIAIGALQGPVVLGYFSIAWRLTELSSFLVTTPLRMAAQSAFAAMHRESGNAARLLLDLATLTAMLSLPAFAGLAVLTSPFVSVVAGKGWEPAASALTVLAVYGGYLCIAKLHQSFVLAIGSPEKLAIVQWAEVAVAVALIVIAGRQGAAAASAALVAAIFLLAPLRLLIVAKTAHLKMRELIVPLLLPATGALVMAAIVWFADRAFAIRSPLLRLFVSGGIGLVFQAGWSWLLMRERLIELAARFKPGAVPVTQG